MTESLEPKVRDNYHTILMAKNMDGVKELNMLVTKSCDPDHFYYNNRITFEEFLGISDNIISTSACLASPLNRLPEDHPMYMRLAEKYDFLEVQGHNHPDQIAFNRKLAKLSRQLNKPLIAGTDTHSSTKYKAECRSVLLASKGKSYGDEDSLDLTYKTYDELVEMFRVQGALSEEDYMSAIENTNMLYGLVEDIELDTSIKYPILYGSREADEKKFEQVVQEKFKEKVERGIITQEQVAGFEAAIPEEMRVFKKLEMMGFMLSMSELTCWCKDNGIPLGPARGSVGGSRAAYVTDITDLNPEQWHTVFSRFANEDRKEIGDIDIDCTEPDRPKIFEYIVGRFGKEKTARVASFGTALDKKVIEDVGRYLAKKWLKENPGSEAGNPWSLKNIAEIKDEYASNPEKTKEKYPDLFYYLDGLVGTKVSQSVHPAGMVISPITLDDNFGCFDKDGDVCLMLDMENVHDFTGLAKYDFLVLKTVQVIKDTCEYIGIPYPKAHEVNWDDQAVWSDMLSSPVGIFQFEGAFAMECLRKFEPHSISDMSIVTACIRPSGTSYRNDLLARKIHKNPSEIIDNLLKENLGYLIYQEDTIRFLQEICGLSGSEADNIRRAIGRKQKDRLDKAMPSILDGYCSKSPKDRADAEEEAKEFLQIIEDSASYQFGKNHSIAYCLLGYLCAYYRHYYPIEFITSFLNNAANEDDIKNGTAYANKVGIKITMPKWGLSKSHYFFDKDKKIIAKGITSIKYMGNGLAEELYDMSKERTYDRFVDLLAHMDAGSSIDSRQVGILIKIDFFSEFGNQRELLRIYDFFYSNLMKKGAVKKIKIDTVDGLIIEGIIKKYSTNRTKNGDMAKSYTVLDPMGILREYEDAVKSVGMDDLDVKIKIQNFYELMGYYGYSTGKDEDRQKLFVLDIYPLCRKRDGKQFGYSIITKSIGSGKESRFTVFNRVFNKDPIKKGDIIFCKSFTRDGIYFTLNSYYKDF